MDYKYTSPLSWRDAQKLENMLVRQTGFIMNYFSAVDDKARSCVLCIYLFQQLENYNFN